MPTPEEIEEEKRIMMANPNYAKFEDVEPPTEVSITTVVLPTEEVLNDSAAEKLAEDFFLDPDNAQHLTELRNNYLDGKIDKEVYDNLVSAYFNEWTYRNENNVLSEGEGPKLH